MKLGKDVIYPLPLRLVHLHLRHFGRRRQIRLQLGERHRRLHALLAYELLHALQVGRLVYGQLLSDLLVQLINDGLVEKTALVEGKQRGGEREAYLKRRLLYVTHDEVLAWRSTKGRKEDRQVGLDG